MSNLVLFFEPFFPPIFILRFACAMEIYSFIEVTFNFQPHVNRRIHNNRVANILKIALKILCTCFKVQTNGHERNGGRVIEQCIDRHKSKIGKQCKSISMKCILVERRA